MICPQGAPQDREPEATIDGVEIHRYPLTAATGGWSGLPARVRGRRSGAPGGSRGRLGRFDVVHVCNPPDLLFLVALPLKLRGARVRSSTSTTSCRSSTCRASAAARTCSTARCCALERLTYRVADVVIATNESYRRVALDRGGKDPERGLRRPQRARPRPLQRRRPRPGAEAGQAPPALLPRRHGAAGRRRLRAARARRAARRCGSDDWHAAFVGSGDCFEEMRALSRRLGLRGPRHVHRPDPGRGPAALPVTADVASPPTRTTRSTTSRR